MSDVPVRGRCGSAEKTPKVCVPGEDGIRSSTELDALYPQPTERALAKQIDHIDAHCAAFIAASPLVLLATCGERGADCSPRGGAPGFVQVADRTTLLLPDHKGNNRLDSLRNLLENPVVGLLFLVPGVHETLRVNGTARITEDIDVRRAAAGADAVPITALVIEVREAFIQCSKALVRADFWNPGRHVDRASLPSLGTVLAAHTGGMVEPEAYDRDAEARLRESLY